eukprot:TRINITY_DN73798_c0_g1_i1.p1 TRINITY_DN73798_c0_g1~~TRINITY_DN73798_c0_g1_i1.p1  ORF type:complete len:636 (+),score=123.50 TRINITY_DN73798_c0_g1_i1:56-1909(+)
MFEDPDFGGDAAIGDVDIQEWRRPIKWRRAGELHEKAKLFGVIQADNISQGELGDCWLLAAIAVLADFPGHILNLFSETSLSEEGKYTIRLFDIKHGWEDVVIDDYIPCDKRGTPLFAQLKGDSGSLWALLLEKAFAKFCGSYERLVSGSASWAWQALTGQPHQARWSRKVEDDKVHWIRWELARIWDCIKKEDVRQSWRDRSLKMSWKGPAQKLSDDEMFETLASYTQASFAITCAIADGGMEEKRTDGLLARHEYSVLQVVCADGVRLVQIRNPWGKGGEWKGAWADAAPEWDAHPSITEDFGGDEENNDGRSWMPWESFADIFGQDIAVCPVTLPCPRNSQMTSNNPEAKGKRCPQCRQRYQQAWVLLTKGSWRRLADGESLCFMCLRSTCRASSATIQLAGVHLQPNLSLAPPPGPRRLEVCKYGPACYRRNPQHFHECFHPSLLPPAPPCAGGCGRSAASGFKTCCQKCLDSPPDVEVSVQVEERGPRALSGVYKAVAGRKVNHSAVWKQEDGDGWLWKGAVWMIGMHESKVGGNSGIIAGSAVKVPHLVEAWELAAEGGWRVDSGISVKLLASSEQQHADFCDARFEREDELTRQADSLLAKWYRKRASTR